MRTVTATRYVTPLREGGSLPAIIEADDDGLYVLKFRGAGQGFKALIAELIAGEIGRAIGLLIPEIVFAELDPELARTEGDPEIQDLIRKSGGLNLALDYLPGSVMFNHVVDKANETLASSIVWFDAFISNIDRTVRNTNMLLWHRRLYLIDHGASLYFHHRWNDYIEKSKDPFPFIKDHVLLKAAGLLEDSDEELRKKISEELISNIINMIPAEWFSGDSAFGSTDQYRDAYIEYLLNRLEHRHFFLEEAIRAKSLL
ncbi:MAG: HipA family kinase [Ignavibacteria bacterium]